MTPTQALVLVSAMALFVAAFAAAGAIPVSTVFIAAGIMGSSAALALALRRWLDRKVASSLSSTSAPGSESGGFKVSSYRPYRSWSVIGTVTTTVAGVAKRFTLHNARQRWELRLIKRLGIGRRLAVNDDEFNREIYVEGDAAVGARLFASADSREAARAIFGMGFFAIEFRHGLLQAFRHGEVPEAIAAQAGPHLLLLSRAAEASAQASSIRVRPQ